ncbi:HlyD family secretion protein [Parapedomonas caeni]
MKQRVRRWALTALVAAVAIWGVIEAVQWFSVGRYLESTDNAYVEAEIAYIAPKVEGYVRAVPVRDNQPVRRGDVLLEIEDIDYRTKATEAEAVVAQRDAMAQALGASIEGQKESIREAAAALASARAELEAAAKDRDRYADLVKSRWVSAQKFEQAKSSAEQARAKVAEKEAALAAARRQLDALLAQRDAVIASRRQSAAQMAQSKVDLGNTVVRAPGDGVVGNRTARVGQYVKPGSVVMALVPLSGVYVVANYKETQVERMKVGQPVTLAVDSFPGVEVHGHIDSLAPASGSRFSLLPPENATGNFTKIVQRLPVKVVLDQPLPKGVRLVPGMSVEATVDTRGSAHG